MSEVLRFPKMFLPIYQTVKFRTAAIFLITTRLYRMYETAFYEAEYFSSHLR